MVDADSIRDIVAQYAGHGWKLRRVLVDSKNFVSDPRVAEILADADVRSSKLCALWFSRRSQPDREAWELRQLSASPYALVEVIPDDVDDPERERRLTAVETRMIENAKRPETSH